MRKNRRFLAIVIWAIAFFVTTSFLFQSSVLAGTLGKTAASPHAEPGNSEPAAVSGESWLNHLHRAFDETSMGKTGRLGPPDRVREEFARWQMGAAPESANEQVTLHGSDLYRMNCRGCHGENGHGAPPEINSVINPVRATSAAAVMERMKAAGMGMSAAEAAKLAQQSKSMLLDRLHRGGQDMPAFPHLGDAEVNSLVAYLRLLAGVPGAQGEQLAVQESRLRVGEHIVKSTCHICHSAAGPNPDPQQLYEGAIPPLSALPLRTSRAEFVRKVTHGAPVVMGAPQQLFRGRMPVFYYLSEDEAADVYLYLGRYPPYQWATFDPGAKSTSAIPPTDQTPVYPAPQVAGELVTGNAGLVEVQPAMTAADTRFEALPVLAGLVAIVLLGLGLGFTVYELMRLSRLREGREWASASVSVKKAFEIGEPRAPVNDHVDRELVA